MALIKDEQVVISGNKVHKPVVVSFAWSNNPEDANLFNREGYTVIPFSTDQWKGATVVAKYSVGQ